MRRVRGESATSLCRGGGQLRVCTKEEGGCRFTQGKRAATALDLQVYAGEGEEGILRGDVWHDL